MQISPESFGESQQRSPSLYRQGLLAFSVLSLTFSSVAEAHEYGQENTKFEVGVGSESSINLPRLAATSVTTMSIEGGSNLTAVMNITATETAGAGYIQAKRHSDAVGAFSSLNLDSPNQTRASLAFAQLDESGTFEVYNQSATHLVADVQGFFADGAIDDVPDIRLFDTRTNHTDALPSGSLIEFHGRPDSTAIINFFADGVRKPGYFQVLPYCGATPGAYSTMNVDKIGQIVNNPAFVRFDGEGKACAYAQASAQWGGDLTAYLNDGVFNDIEDTRLVDTRTSTSKPRPGTSITIDGKPNSTGVVSIIATETDAPGYVQVVSEGVVEGSSSNLNVDGTGQTRAALAFVRFGSDGHAKIFTQNGTHLIADLQGYMNEGWFTDIADKRIYDSRESQPLIITDTLLSYTGIKPVQDTDFDTSCLVRVGANGVVQQTVTFNVRNLQPTTNQYSSPIPNGDVVTISGQTKTPSGIRFEFYDREATNNQGVASLQRVSYLPTIPDAQTLQSEGLTVTVDHKNGLKSESLFSINGICSVEFIS